LNKDGLPSLLITMCKLPNVLPNTAPSKASPAGESQYMTRTTMQPINTQPKHSAAGARAEANDEGVRPAATAVAAHVPAAPATCIGMSKDLPPAECAAWMDLYDATGGTNWAAPFNGCRLDPCNAWDGQGVLCSEGHIRVVVLAKAGLVGTLPASLLNMTELTDLFLSDNTLNGSIPESLASLAHLKVLHLISNRLVGRVPALPFAQYTDCCIQFSGKNHFACPLPPNAEKCTGPNGTCNLTCSSTPTSADGDVF
jgi:hypothetical protein